MRKIRTDWGKQLVTVTYEDAETNPDAIELTIEKTGHFITGLEP